MTRDEPIDLAVAKRLPSQESLLRYDADAVAMGLEQIAGGLRSRAHSQLHKGTLLRASPMIMVRHEVATLSWSCLFCWQAGTAAGDVAVGRCTSIVHAVDRSTKVLIAE
jgi:hypothetical protein